MLSSYVVIDYDFELVILSILKLHKCSLLSANSSVHKFDIICLSQTYLNSETPPDDKNLKIAWYNLVREDHPSNSKRGGVCVYYKSSLRFRVINVKYMQESVSFELRIGVNVPNFLAFIGLQVRRRMSSLWTDFR